MPYITQCELENMYGVANVRAWSNLENTTTASNAARVAAAIAWAGAVIDARFSPSVYVTPLRGESGALPMVQQWAAGLAAWNLYTSRGLREDDPAGQKLTTIRRQIEFEMRQAAEGAAGLPAVRVGRSAPTAPVVCE